MESQTLEEWITEHGGQSKFFPIKQLVTVLNGYQIEGPRMVRSQDGKVIVVGPAPFSAPSVLSPLRSRLAPPIFQSLRTLPSVAWRVQGVLKNRIEIEAPGSQDELQPFDTSWMAFRSSQRACLASALVVVAQAFAASRLGNCYCLSTPICSAQWRPFEF